MLLHFFDPFIFSRIRLYPPCYSCQEPQKYPTKYKIQPHRRSWIKAQPISSKSFKNIVYFFNLFPICETFVLRINKLKGKCPKGPLSSSSTSLNYTQPVHFSMKFEKLLKTLRLTGLEWFLGREADLTHSFTDQWMGKSSSCYLTRCNRPFLRTVSPGWDIWTREKLKTIWEV